MMASNSFQKLRISIGAHYFKSCILGDKHNPQAPQSYELLHKLQSIDENRDFISADTWERWINRSLKTTPREETVIKLEDVLSLQTHTSSQFLQQLIFGSLADTIRLAQKSNRYIKKAEKSIRQYTPFNSIIAFLDAMEIATAPDLGLSEEHKYLKINAIESLFEYVFTRWNRKQGSIYNQLSSNLALQWQHENESNRIKIEKVLSNFKPNLFDHMMSAPATPNWEIINVSESIEPSQIITLLFALLSDTDFVKADRLSALAWDIPTACMALHAKCNSLPHLYFGKRISPEAHFLNAWDTVFCQHLLDEELSFTLRPTAELCGVEDYESFLKSIKKLQKTYQSNLSELGISLSFISTLFENQVQF